MQVSMPSNHPSNTPLDEESIGNVGDSLLGSNSADESSVVGETSSSNRCNSSNCRNNGGSGGKELVGGEGSGGENSGGSYGAVGQGEVNMHGQSDSTMTSSQEQSSSQSRESTTATATPPPTLSTSMERETGTPNSSGEKKLTATSTETATTTRESSENTCTCPVVTRESPSNETCATTITYKNVKVLPWLKLNGELNNVILKRFHETVLVYVLANPGVLESHVLSHFALLLKPAAAHKILDFLVINGAISRHYLWKKKVTLFGGSSSQRHAYYMPTMETLLNMTDTNR